MLVKSVRGQESLLSSIKVIKTDPATTQSAGAGDLLRPAEGQLTAGYGLGLRVRGLGLRVEGFWGLI